MRILPVIIHAHKIDLELNSKTFKSFISCGHCNVCWGQPLIMNKISQLPMLMKYRLQSGSR